MKYSKVFWLRDISKQLQICEHQGYLKFLDSLIYSHFSVLPLCYLAQKTPMSKAKNDPSYGRKNKRRLKEVAVTQSICRTAKITIHASSPLWVSHPSFLLLDCWPNKYVPSIQRSFSWFYHHDQANWEQEGKWGIADVHGMMPSWRYY